MHPPPPPPDDLDGLRAEALALARDYRERAECEALLVDAVLPDDGLPASDALRAYLGARVQAWRVASRALEIANEISDRGGLVGALEGVLSAFASRRRRGPEAAHPVFDTVAPRVTELHARADRESRDRVRREVDELEQHEERRRHGEEWKGDDWRDDGGDAWRGAGGGTA